MPAPGTTLNSLPVLTDDGSVWGQDQPPQQQQQGDDGYWWPKILQHLWNTVKSGATLPGDVATGNASMNDPATQQRVGDMTALTTLGAGAAPAEADALNMGIRAYHASPYDFDRFDINKIGTGEGAQTYGHGLYFAENPQVADAYYRQFANRATDPMSPAGIAQNVLNAPGIQGDRLKAINEMQGRISSWQKLDPRFQLPNGDQRLQSSLDLLKDPNWPPPPAQRYEVDINAEPDQFLDWNRSLAQQSPLVREAANQVVGQQTSWRFTPRTGEDVIRAAQNLNPARPGVRDPAYAANALLGAGVPGVSYLDQVSRGAGEGSRNYVSFSDKIIDILRKLGPPRPGATP